MFRNAMSLVRQIPKISPISNQVRLRSRSVWDLVSPSTDIQRVIREMDRRMDAFERDFFKFSPFRFISPRMLPVEGNGHFRVDVDVSGFQPEDIKLTLKDGKLHIEAKMDKTDSDGSRVQQYLAREFTVPENLDKKSIESYLSSSGILTIEASNKTESPRKIDITLEDEKPAIGESENEKPKSKL